LTHFLVETSPKLPFGHLGTHLLETSSAKTVGETLGHWSL
jgi:hypothetical protein